MNVLVNIVAFKVAWLSTIFGGANELPMLGPLVVSLAVALHLWLATEPTRELILVLMTGAIGLAWDSVLVSAGWLVYPTGTIVSGLAPYWILAMWMLFATTLNVAFRWLQTRLVLAALMGAVFGPISYVGGAAAGAVELVAPMPALVALGVAWALLMPGLLLLARQLDGTQPSVIRSRL
jgi:hypothetical protein